MGLKAALSIGLNAVPECTALCYVDMSADLVLATEARRRRPQEVFNSLCALARDVLQQGPAQRLAKDATGSADIAVLAGERGTLVFTRAHGHEGHALCLLCDPTEDVDNLGDQTRAMREAVANAM